MLYKATSMFDEISSFCQDLSDWTFHRDCVKKKWNSFGILPVAKVIGARESAV